MRNARRHGAVLFLLITCLPLSAQGQKPGTSEAQFTEQSQQLIRTGQLSAADRLLKEAIRVYPQSGGLYNLIGIVAAEQNRQADAEAAFRKSVQYSPALTPALLNLARVFYSQGKKDAAIQTYRRALRVDDHLEEAHANLAGLLLDKGDYAGAGQQLSVLPDSVQQQNRFRAMECAAFAGRGKVDRAKEVLAEMTGAITEEDVSLGAFTLAKLHENELVIQMLAPVSKEHSSRELRGLLATAYARNGNLAQARAGFESLAREDPKQTNPLIEAARIAYQQKDYEGAAGYLISALKNDPNDASTQFFFGIVCVSLNLPGDAVHALKEAVRLEPENATYNYALGAASLSGQSSDAAVSCFKKYVELRPADPHGHLALGTAEFEAGNLEAARRELSSLVSNPSVSAGAHYILGKLSRREGDLDSARDHFAEAAKLDPHDAILEANLAGVYIRQNRFLEARHAIDRALALDPNNYLANENLLTLLRKQKDPQAEQQAQRFAALTQKLSEDQALLFRHIEVAQ
jgi:tetratricopeptide (TPR) repeat protein